MRNLIYVPVIHSKADLGSVATHATEKGKSMIGEEAWKRHEYVIDKFWDSITKYFSSLKVKGFKIYQDGLVADGELGMKIVNESAKKGSRNYRIIKQLVKKGAKIMKTEDLSIIKNEIELIMKMLKAESAIGRLKGALNYKLKKGEILKIRDEFIAKQINGTLKNGETGILFLGAFHNVIPKLADDIDIIEIKEKSKLEEYEKNFYIRNKKDRVEKLAKYIISPVKLKR